MSTLALPNERAQRGAAGRVASFRQRFGDIHLYLAYHAAFPLALTPDLLYSLWANFQRDSNGNLVAVPWIAVADLLLSGLCNEVGHELYEMDDGVRSALLRDMERDPRLGPQRIADLSEFLIAYVHRQFLSSNPDERDFAQTQHWAALAYVRPEEVERELAGLLAVIPRTNTPELIRIGSVVETLAQSHDTFVSLLEESRKLTRSARSQRQPAAGRETTPTSAGVRQAPSQTSSIDTTASTSAASPPVSTPSTFAKSARTAARSLSDLFVGRERQLANFRRSLAGQTSKRIVLVSGGPGMGKSWLVRKFIDECLQQSLPFVLLDFSDNTQYDVLLLMRRFRDALGPENFNLLTQTINDITIPHISIGSDTNDAPGEVAVSTINPTGSSLIKDNLFVLQSNSSLNRQELENRVTEAFFYDLNRLTNRTKVVFLFDSYERTALSLEPWISSATDRWISTELLRRMREGSLFNTVVVLTGRRLPPFGAEWGDLIGTMLLDTLTQEEVARYLRENRGLSDLSNEQVNQLFQAVQGNPQLLGVIGDNLEYASGNSQDDQW